jgi:hypothetical protein
VAFATSEVLADLDAGWPYLRDALDAVGLVPSVVFWDDPAVVWASYDIVVAIYVWGYVLRRDLFLAWVDEVEATTRLVNQPSVLRWNSDKTYLGDLDAVGVPVVPTQWVPPGGRWTAPTDDFVVKPSVSSGGIGAARYRTLGVDVADRHVGRLHDEGHTVMVQPYQAAVDTTGETALVFLGERYSHCVHKAALLAADVGETEELWTRQVITTATPRPDQRAVADAALEAVADRFGPTSYARVDLVDSADGRPLVLELELVEPSLFLTHRPAAAAQLAAHLAAMA